MNAPVDEKLVDGLVDSLADEYAGYFKLDTSPQVSSSICVRYFTCCFARCFGSIRDCNLRLCALKGLVISCY